MCHSFTDCGYKRISDAVDSKLKLQKCDDDGMNPAGPCLKQLNNKKHFIIHTPEHDKVLPIMISCQLNYSCCIVLNTNYYKFGNYMLIISQVAKSVYIQKCLEVFRNP